MSFEYTVMQIAEYEEMYALWRSIPGVRLNDADEKKCIQTYLLHNPGQSFICKADERIIGTIMCGNDGRRAFIYHLAVSLEYRRRGIGTELIRLAIEQQKSFGIDKCAIFILTENTTGKCFWRHLGFEALQEAETMVKSI